MSGTSKTWPRFTERDGNRSVVVNPDAVSMVFDLGDRGTRIAFVSGAHVEVYEDIGDVCNALNPPSSSVPLDRSV